MSTLHKSIASILSGKIINEEVFDHHAEVVKKLNAVSKKKVHGEEPNFHHAVGNDKEQLDDQKLKHKSPVKDHYSHEHENMQYSATVSHHKDNTATVRTVHYKNASLENDDEGDEYVHEKHLKDLPSAIEHVKKLHNSK
jgi:hypothetical protein